ncbi:MAG: hypothetical protein HDQ97_19280 [Lachnospiraceae bacterium]|nr:hypothetical protein [Lachnospiraceae bacterium]
MRLIDADKIDFNEVFKGQSDFAKDTREAAQSLIDSQPTAYDMDKVVEQFEKEKNPMYREDGSLMSERTDIKIDRAIGIVKAEMRKTDEDNS